MSISKWVSGAAVVLVVLIGTPMCTATSTSCIRFSDCADGLTCASGMCVVPPVMTDGDAASSPATQTPADAATATQKDSAASDTAEASTTTDASSQDGASSDSDASNETGPSDATGDGALLSSDSGTGSDATGGGADGNTSSGGNDDAGPSASTDSGIASGD